MKKIFILASLCISHAIYAVPTPSGIITTDLNVMNKDVANSMNTFQYYHDLLKSADDMNSQMSKNTSLIDSMKNINNTDIWKLCTGCSDYTVAQLEDYKKSMAASWCNQVSNTLDFAKSQFSNGSEIKDFLEKLSSAISSKTLDPSALSNALQGATTKTLSSLNQTTQMMAAQQANDKQEQEIKSQIAKKRMDYAITGDPRSLQ